MAQVALANGKVATLTVDSVLIPVAELKPEAVDAIRNACVGSALVKAHQLWPGQVVTVRDLNASDMGYTNNIYVETSNGTGNQWNAMAAGSFTVATGTVIGIYGVKLGTLADGTNTQLQISGIRVEVGGARVAQWHCQSLDQSGNAASSVAQRFTAGVTKSPVIVSEDISVTLYEYTRVTGTLYYPIWLGVAVEKEGITLKP